MEGEKWRGLRQGDKWGGGFCWPVWVGFEVDLGGGRCWCLFRRLWRAGWLGVAFVLAACVCLRFWLGLSKAGHVLCAWLCSRLLAYAMFDYRVM